MNPSVAIDVGTASVDLCSWHGGNLLIDKVPFADPISMLPHWLERLSPPPRFELVLRSTWDGIDGAQEERFRDAAMTFGARWLRIVAADCPADPGVAAARQAADRLRLGVVWSVEIGATRATTARVDRRGAAACLRHLPLPASLKDSPPSGESLDPDLRRLFRAERRPDGSPAPSRVPLVCFGGAGPTLATAIADCCGASSVVIPVHAGTLACIGLLISDIVLDFRETWPPRPLNMPFLRQAFLRLMDSACDAVAAEGYDLDDTICDRTVEMAPAGSASAVRVEADALAEAALLLKRFRQTWTAAHGSAETNHPIEIRAAAVRATVATTKPPLPLPNLPHGGSNPASASQEARTRKSRSAGGCVRRYELPPGATVHGPATITERHTETRVGAGWSAVVQPTSDLWLQRED
ncbi:MAG: hydantoinase/oxoprolinase family protein [Phycisphaerae bacterium]